MPPRSGLNTTLSYYDGTNLFNSAIRLRTASVTYEYAQVAQQTQGRTYKTFYPHLRSQAQFSIGILLKGYEEYRVMNNWFASYVKYSMTSTYENGVWPVMNVTVESRDFVRKGIPLGPFEWGDHIGSMVWTPTIVFQTVGEPGDDGKIYTSEFNDNLSSKNDSDSKFFYPAQPQLNGDDLSSNQYQTVSKPSTLSDLQKVVNG